MTLVLAVDFDGTMFPFQAALSRWWASEGRSPNLPEEPDCWHYWRTLDMTDEDFTEAIDAFGESGGFRSEAPYPEALIGIGALFDAGCDLIGVTSRPPSRAIEQSTYGWISDWFLPLRAVLLGPSAKLEAECDILIDDNPAELVALAELGEACGLLLDRPWNQECDLFPRVSWAELPMLIERLSEAVAGEPDSERRFALAEAFDEIGE